MNARVEKERSWKMKGEYGGKRDTVEARVVGGKRVEDKEEGRDDERRDELREE